MTMAGCFGISPFRPPSYVQAPESRNMCIRNLSDCSPELRKCQGVHKVAGAPANKHKPKGAMLRGPAFRPEALPPAARTSPGFGQYSIRNTQYSIPALPFPQPLTPNPQPPVWFSTCEQHFTEIYRFVVLHFARLVVHVHGGQIASHQSPTLNGRVRY